MEEKNNVIELRPVSKWKRFLLFLADFAIAFIVSFALFNLAVFPLAKIVFDTQKQSESALLLEKEANEMLVSGGFLFAPNEGASFEDSVNYSFKRFLSYYAFDDATVDEAHQEYGHRLENETILTYYQNVINDTNKYLVDFKEVNQEDDMFVIGETINDIALKSDYKVSLANELLEVSDESKYSTAMTNFRDHIYAKLFYLKVYQHILDNDYVKDGVSYNNCLKEARKIMDSLQWVVSGSALVSIFLAWGITYLIYPLFSKDHKTIGMAMMRISKLHYKSLSPIGKSHVVISSFYAFLFLMSFAVFLPILFFGLSYSFNLPLLFILGIISLVLMIAGGMFIFFNEHNRSGSDILTNVVLLPDSEIDNMYKAQFDDGK